VISETPHLRIVTDELAIAMRRRLQTVKQMFGKDGGGLAAGPKRYLFSGLLKCGVCGGSIVLVCGRGRHGADRYGCSLHHQRGDSVCRNRLLVRRDELEESLLRGLSESVLRTEVIDYAVARMEDALRKRFEELDAELEQLRQRKQQIEAEIARLIRQLPTVRVHRASRLQSENESVSCVASLTNYWNHGPDHCAPHWTSCERLP
jgi:site-specific DNA recombinase